MCLPMFICCNEYYVDDIFQGYCVTVYSNDKNISIPEIDYYSKIENIPIYETEYDREVRFLSDQQYLYEHLFFCKNKPELKYNTPKNNLVLKDKYRLGLGRRTLLIDSHIIRKEFSGSQSKDLYTNGLNYLRDKYPERLKNTFSNDAAKLYFFDYESFEKEKSLYDLIFNEEYNLNDLYKKYLNLIKKIYPYCHLDLHGDNVIIDKNDEWHAIDFESIVQCNIAEHWHIANGLFIQMIRHKNKKPIQLLSLKEFENYVKL